MSIITSPRTKMKFSIRKWIDWSYRYMSEDFKKSFPPEQLMKQYLWVVDIDGLDVTFIGDARRVVLPVSSDEGTRTLTINKVWCVLPEEFVPYTGPKPLSNTAVDEMYEDYKAWSGNKWGGGDIEDDIDNIIKREKPAPRKGSRGYGSRGGNGGFGSGKGSKDFSMRDYIYGKPEKPAWYNEKIGRSSGDNTIDGRINEVAKESGFFDDGELPF